MPDKYDLAVLGSGPGGYVAALKAAQMGLSVCLIEKESLGGVCLNWGCIPTKALLKSAHMLELIKQAEQFAINIDRDSLSLDFEKLQKRKSDIVAKLIKGIEFLLKKRNIEIIYGQGTFIDKNSIIVQDRIIGFEKCIIATGSVPRELNNIKFDDALGVLSNRGILSLKAVPEELLIIGGGVIGCEFADVFSCLGSKVTIIELADQLLPGEDKDIAQVLAQEFKRKKIRIFTSVSVDSVNKQSAVEKIEIVLSNGEKCTADKILLSVGRKPNIEGFDLHKTGIEPEGGKIVVDESMRTGIDNIFAIGDVTGKYLLAHVAHHQGIVAAENIAGLSSAMHYNAIPRCVYTKPEVAGVGLTQAQAEKMGIDIKIGKFSFIASGKAAIEAEAKGFVKVIAAADDDRILEAAICGPGATEIIQEIAVAVGSGLKAGQLASIIHAHPTISEAIMEAAQDVNQQAVHVVR